MIKNPILSNKSWKIIFHKNTNLHGICMIYPKLTIHIHIPNIKESIKVFAWRQETHGYTCIFIRFELKIHIHEVKTWKLAKQV